MFPCGTIWLHGYYQMSLCDGCKSFILFYSLLMEDGWKIAISKGDGKNYEVLDPATGRP
jgi:hypothetical protein